MGALIILMLTGCGFYVLFRWLGTLTKVSPRLRLLLGLGAGYLLTASALWFICTPWTLPSTAAGAAIAWKLAKPEGWEAIAVELRGYRLPIYLLSVFGIALLVLVTIPITTFLTSPGELDIHLQRMLRVNGRNVMVVLYAAIALYIIASSAQARTVLALCSLAAFALCLIYAFVFPLGYPMMSGLAFEQLPISAVSVFLRSLVDLAVVTIVGLAIVFALRRFGPRPVVGALILANLSVGIAAAVSARSTHVGTAGSAATDETSLKPLRLSSSHPNTVIIFLDRFMGSYVELHSGQRS